MSNNDVQAQIQDLQQQLMTLGTQLRTLQARATPEAVPNYEFQTPQGPVTLLELFAGKDTLFAIHNMGKGCRYCTLWADGLNAFLPHLEDGFAVALLSKDDPADQRRMANDRGWRFFTASHGGGAYIQEQSVIPGEKNMPGLVCYLREGEQVLRKNAVTFGPGDQFCSFWNVLGLAGRSEADVTPQFSYWQRPEQMEDGGANLR